MKTTQVLKFASVLLAGGLGLAAQTTPWQASADLLLPEGSVRNVMGLTNGLRIGGAYEFKTENGYSFRPGFNLGLMRGGTMAGIEADADMIIANNAYNGATGALSYNNGTIKQSLTQMQVAADILVPTSAKTTLVVGLSLNKYSVKTSGGRAASANPSFDPAGGIGGAGAYTYTDKGVYSPVGLDNATYVVDPNGSGGLLRSGDPNGTVSVPGIKLGLRLGLEVAFNKHWSGQILAEQTELGRMISKPSAIPTMNPFYFAVGATYHF